LFIFILNLILILSIVISFWILLYNWFCCNFIIQHLICWELNFMIFFRNDVFYLMIIVKSWHFFFISSFDIIFSWRMDFMIFFCFLSIKLYQFHDLSNIFDRLTRVFFWVALYIYIYIYSLVHQSYFKLSFTIFSVLSFIKLTCLHDFDSGGSVEIRIWIDH